MQIPVETVWRWLSEVPDPEIPVLSLPDLGVIRDVRWDQDTLVVTVTQTYSGCPATSVINLDIETKLRSEGISKLRLEQKLSPAWTTDWLSAEGREKLRQYGIAPPAEENGADTANAKRANRLLAPRAVPVDCPRCGSSNTERISQFGSTPCKAAYRCKACLEPFDYFKCH
ncbi:phenylacetate-CoA oxygenase subunit PaaJ [Roseibium denhamense]|uniref:Ring-1,2-phenylacetyl-CoA epoxidase subunit PaaD n=1 Tax=Roseibium denhamense TaxID=76305 RepID=A0ABY1PE20_9HYPH|nr:1,2-phenylacetyl-CoA epoxidase subunit PaaD [Roseibium denhamense]MTI06135.1 phenylacetate-CoA oxygenase subunit PaaJ [Roseibium denhamense]SMP32174.1 ring-1,2-phenylacetyl-CoA epoxidase subunit PaaD [Roseibium denhamense]